MNRKNKGIGAIGAVLIVFAILALLALIIGAFVIGVQNGIIAKSIAVDNEYAGVEADLQRRFDLIPNVVEVTKDFMQWEQSVLENVTKYRSAWANANTMEEQLDAGTGMGQIGTQIIVAIEAYPELKSDAIVQDLITELEGTENRIKVARLKYNEAVRAYNTDIQTFPGNMFASGMGYFPRPYFSAVDGASTAPTVDLYD